MSESLPGRRRLRRYDNRKLYEPAERRYVTLAQIADWVADGQEVEVLEQRSGHDLTNVVLAQILFERVKDRSASIPRSVLLRLIRLSGPRAAWPEWASPREAAALAREEAERIAAGLMGRGRLTLEEALALRHEIAGSAQRLLSDAQRGLEARLQRLFEPGEGALTLAGLKERLLALATEPEVPQAAASGPAPRPRRGRRRPAPAAPGSRRPPRRR